MLEATRQFLKNICMISKQIHPEWKMMDYFVVSITQSVFLVDSNELALPMTYYVEHPVDIDFHFNSIAFSKGL